MKKSKKKTFLKKFQEDGKSEKPNSGCSPRSRNKRLKCQEEDLELY
jgi:hypothetical protein